MKRRKHAQTKGLIPTAYLSAHADSIMVDTTINDTARKTRNDKPHDAWDRSNILFFRTYTQKKYACTSISQYVRVCVHVCAYVCIYVYGISGSARGQLPSGFFSAPLFFCLPAKTAATYLCSYFLCEHGRPALLSALYCYGRR